MDPESVRSLIPELTGELPVEPATGLLAATVDWDVPRDVLKRLMGMIPGVLAAVELGEILGQSA
jgi:hypothetical protein